MFVFHRNIIFIMFFFCLFMFLIFRFPFRVHRLRLLHFDKFFGFFFFI